MRKPRVFDGFCKAGGAGEGYRRAGFEVVGMDITPQPNYAAGAVLCMNVLSMKPDFFRTFDLLHFSPPCQGYTELRSAPRAKPTGHHPLLISAVRTLAQRSGVPYVIENVRQAAWAMQGPVTLHGGHFALGVPGVGRLLRERLFETSWPGLETPPEPGPVWDAQPVLGVYGGHVRRRAAGSGGRGTSERGWMPPGVPHRQLAGALMGIDWMTMAELDEAIPPAYTEWVGRRFRAWKGL